MNHEKRESEKSSTKQTHELIAFDPANAGHGISESPEFSNIFPRENAPGPPIIRAFGTDNPLVSPVTIVLNVQLQKTPYLDKTNDDTEKQ